MELDRAYLVLGASRTDSYETVRRKYHQMMQMYHPDAAGEDEASLFLAQQINEAHEVIRRALQEGESVFQSAASAAGAAVRAHAEAARAKSRAQDAEKNRTVWDAGENPHAFTERLIYEGSGMYDSGEILWHESRRGRFNWDPYQEDFRIFAKSVNDACGELLEKEERRFDIYDRSELPDPGMQDLVRLQLFHLLMQQYIRPSLCLERIAQDHERDEEIPGKYMFDCAVGLRGSEQLRLLAHVQNGDMLPLSMDGERMMASTREHLPLGHVSFHEDSLYYVISMLLREGKLMEAQVRSITENRSSRPMTARLSLRLHVRLDGTEAADVHTHKANRKMAALLENYRSALEEAVI